MTPPGMVVLQMRCRCPVTRLAMARLGRAMLRHLAETGAPAEMVVATTWCKLCKTETTHHLSELVPWREAA